MNLSMSFRLLATYNQMMNTRLYQLASELPVGVLKENKGAFFGSIQNTLNHVLVGDILWLSRFAKHPAQFSALAAINSFPIPTSLDHLLYENFSEQSQQRKKLDAIIIDWCNELNAGHLDHNLAYQSIKGDRFIRNFGGLVMHLFNHQTHHRGQVTTLLSQSGIDFGVTDLLTFVPNLNDET